MGSALDVLAERVGIQAEFEDALGKRHQTPLDKKQALLKAMHLAAEDDAQAAATLEELDRQEWEQALPPCVVLYEGKPSAAPVNFPAGHPTLQWTLTLEGGDERRGEAAFASLEKVATFELGGKPLERRLLGLPGGLPWGYHRLRLDSVEGAETSLIVTPGRCWLPGEDAEADQSSQGKRRRFWGVSAQLYLLRSERNWGIGDFSDLRRLVEIVREQGGDAVGVNPLHGMFPDQPEQASPYSPLSRYLLNVLNIDVEAIPEFAQADAAQKLVKAPEFQERLARARKAKMVAYEDVAALKLPVLQAVFLEFESAGTAERKGAFEAFQRGCDELLTSSCLYAAIRQYMTDQGPKNQDCGEWPEDLQHADAPGVARFRQNHAELVRYHLWLQWVADEQLHAVKQACEGMAVGVYRDLAVGASPAGAETWSNPDVMVATAEVGAPPDTLNTAGQNWALPPFHPQKMKEDGYRGFIALLRTNMRHAGGLRIDHAMALQRLYWIPRGGSPPDGGYVHYPTDDMVGVIALESHRNKCLVVGEDLGTVAPGFRERMTEAQVLSYRVLLLEKAKTGWVKGEAYPHLALSTASSHDLPTLRGWWEDVDLDLREQLGLVKPEEVKKGREERNTDREAMLELFREEGLLEGNSWPLTEEFVDAAHRFLARTQAVLMMAQIEDVAGVPEQVNLPASMPDQYPSWSRRVPVTLEELPTHPGLARLVAIAKEERGAGPGKL